MRRRGRILLVLALTATVVFSYAYHQIFNATVDRRPSTYSAYSTGAKALYLLLKEMNIPVGRHERPLMNLNQQGTLVVLGPLSRPPAGKELIALKKWIAHGNTLVLLYGLPTDDWRKELLKSPGNKAQVYRTRMATAFGLQIKGFDHGDRGAAQANVAGLPEPLNISVSREFRWTDFHKDWEVLTQDEQGPIIMKRRMGGGAVYAVSDTSLFSNTFINKDQNVRFALALLLSGKSRNVIFDEYHHGYSKSQTVSSMMLSSVFLWIFLQIVVAAALFIYSRRAYHAGRFKTLAEPAGRSSLEYVYSMANIFETVKAGAPALEAIFQRFVSKTAKKLGAPVASLMKGEISTGRTIHGAAPPEALIREVQSAIESEAKPARCLELAKKLAEARSSMDKR